MRYDQQILVLGAIGLTIALAMQLRSNVSTVERTAWAIKAVAAIVTG